MSILNIERQKHLTYIWLICVCREGGGVFRWRVGMGSLQNIQSGELQSSSNYGGGSGRDVFSLTIDIFQHPAGTQLNVGRESSLGRKSNYKQPHYPLLQITLCHVYICPVCIPYCGKKTSQTKCHGYFYFHAKKVSKNYKLF